MIARSEHPHYEITEPCGEGGMGVVYKARDKRLNRIVALKFLIPVRDEANPAVTRFQREAEAIAALNHPNVATIFETGVWDGEPFLALEYLPGGTLRDKENAGGLSLSLVLKYAAQLASGLEFAHSKGILHRDIKPGNCMFDAHGSLKLLDFGLAKYVGGEEITRPGTTVGTIPYMAPELLLGEAASVRSDLYALGAVVYELAAGRPMYSRTGTASVAEEVLKGSAVPLAQLRPDLPAAFCEAVSRATARLQADRQPSVGAFLNALRRSAPGIVTGEEATRTLTEAIGVRRRNRRRKGLLLAASAVAAAGALAVVNARWGHELWGHELTFGSGSPVATETMVVLPFENLGADPANQALCDGLQETVTSILSSAVELRNRLLIVPSSEVRRSQIRTISEARSRFSATLVLTGSTQPGTKDLELTLDLTDARSMREKDSRIVTVPAGEKASLQRQLSESLGAMLGARSLLGSGARPEGDTTVSSVAYDLFLQGSGALDDNDLDSAVSFLAKSVEADSGFALARAKLAQAYLRKNNETKDTKWLAMADLEATKAALGGQSPEVLMSQAMIRKATGNSQEAIALFRKVLQSDPGNVEALRLLADTLDSAGRLKEAEDTYLQGLRLRPGYWPLYDFLGDFYSRHQRYSEAERTFSTGITLAAETPSLYYNLGAMYFRMSRWEDAAKAFEKSLAVKPNALAYANLGTVRFFQGNYTEAAKQMELATKLQPANYKNWGNLGDALWQLAGGRERARAAFDHAAGLANQQLEINPDDAIVRKSYALYLAKLGRAGEAVAEARKAVAQAPEKEGIVQFYAARVFTVTGDRDAALAALRNCVALGYSVQEIREEPDFAPLRRDPRYQGIAGSAQVSGKAR